MTPPRAEVADQLADAGAVAADHRPAARLDVGEIVGVEPGVLHRADHRARIRCRCAMSAARTASHWPKWPETRSAPRPSACAAGARPSPGRWGRSRRRGPGRRAGSSPRSWCGRSCRPWPPRTRRRSPAGIAGKIEPEVALDPAAEVRAPPPPARGRSRRRRRAGRGRGAPGRRRCSAPCGRQVSEARAPCRGGPCLAAPGGAPRTARGEPIRSPSVLDRVDHHDHLPALEARIASILPNSVTSSATRSSSLRPRSAWAISRPRKRSVILTLSPPSRNLVTERILTS